MSNRGPLRVLVAPDSFKGSLSSVEVASALAEGWRRARPEDEVTSAPLADGGEGTLAAIHASGGWEWQECEAIDPLGRPIAARWLRSQDGRRAAVELAEAVGLSRLPRDEPRSPLTAATDGCGQILKAALDSGVRHVVMGLGGSATTDGGAGLLRSLGVEFTANAESPLPGPIPDVVGVDLAGLDPRLAEVDLRVACDVTNPLLGEQGAAAIYAPQKGAWPEDVTILETWLSRYADLLETACGVQVRSAAGAGAAGGTGFALMCLAPHLHSFKLIPGVELVMQETGFYDRLTSADLVITGEGQVDAQTAFGKTAYGVARRAAAGGIPCVAIGGGVTGEGAAILCREGALAVPVLERPMPLADAMAQAYPLVADAGERLARTLALGAAVTVRRARRVGTNQQ